VLYFFSTASFFRNEPVIIFLALVSYHILSPHQQGIVLVHQTYIHAYRRLLYRQALFRNPGIQNISPMLRL